MKGFGAIRHKAAVALLHVAQSTEMIPSMGPPSPPEYICLQFDILGISSLYNFSSLKSCRPAHYPIVTPPTLTILNLRAFPETDAPAPSPSVVSSVSATASLVDDKTHDKWHRDRWRLIESASKSDDLRLPSDKRKFPNWERIFASEVGGAAWSADSHSILQHTSTNPGNATASKDLASLLNKCAIRSGNAVLHHKLLGSPGHDYLHNDLGVKLWTHIKTLYNLTSAGWLWDYLNDWSTLQHNPGETIAALAWSLSESQTLV
jgi:hypothetical protein